MNCKPTLSLALCLALPLAMPLAALAAGAESSMMELQSSMSQRATALQLTTSMQQTLNDSMHKVAGNLGGAGGGKQIVPANRDIAALNPQPLPPKERAAANPVPAYGSSLAQRGIIIVGGRHGGK